MGSKVTKKPMRGKLGKKSRKEFDEEMLDKGPKKSKSYKVKKPMPISGLMGPAASGGIFTKRPMGGKVYKVDNSGQNLVQKMYGGKIKK